MSMAAICNPSCARIVELVCDTVDTVRKGANGLS
jgi:hypothetical protein